MPELDAVDRLTAFYGAIDQAIPNRPPAWQPPPQGGLRRQSWPIQLLATAVVLAFALALGFLIREAKLHQTPQPISPYPGARVVNSVYGVPPMGFSSAQDGWVLNGNGLMITRDGGQHWRDASPRDISSSCCTVYFLDHARGWASGGWWSSSYPISSHTQGLPIFRTLDGGNSWNLVGRAGGPPSTSAGPATLDFVDERHGWLIYWDSTNNGTPIGQLQRTTDGGATWTWPATLPAAPDRWNYGPLPPRTWIRFIDRSTGWFIGEDAARYGGQQLYVTHDGGSTWQPQAVPVPPEATGGDNRIGLPGRVNNKLVLPITLADGRVLLDSSNDEGSTWKMDAPLFGRGAAAERQGTMAPTFVGNGVIALVLGDQLELNAGEGWTSIRPTGVPGDILDIAFVNRQVGWALSTQTCQDCPHYQFVLLKTTDGGHTWSHLGA